MIKNLTFLGRKKKLYEFNPNSIQLITKFFQLNLSLVIFTFLSKYK
jgi:hypothetical protein